MTDQALVDTTGWSADGANQWKKARGGELRVVSSPVDAVALPEVGVFRDRMRDEILTRGGGLVSAEVSSKGVGVVIAKFPQTPSGMTYEGLLVVVRDRSEHRVTIRFPEVGFTGMRDTIVYALHLQQLPEGADRTAGWMQDPYDPTRDDKLMRNSADDEQHDRKFPEHPLTLLRAELERLLPSVS